MEKDWPKRPSDHQLQEAQKKTLIGLLRLWWRQPVSAHTSHHQSTCKPSSCATFMLNSHWGRAAAGKKALHLCMQGCFGRVRLCNLVDCGLPGFSIREGGSPGRNTGVYWPILVATPF